MTLAENLKEEHEGITLMLTILERVCAKMGAKEKVDQGRSYVRAMGYGLTQMKKVGGDAGAEYAANAQEHIALMTQHIQKENNVLFPMLDRLLAKKK